MGIAILVPGADYSERNLGQVTINGTIPVTGISIIGPDEIATSGQYRASFAPPFTTQRGVTWSITSGSQYASILPSGVLVAAEGASSSPVTIRCTSIADNTIYAEKTVSVTAGDLIIKNYIQGDGVGFFVLPGGFLLGGKITYRGTYASGNNTYNLCSMYSSGTGTGSKSSRIAMYTNSNGKVTGMSGMGGFGTLSKSNIIYRYIWQLSSTTESSDGIGYIYNDETGALLNTGGSGAAFLNGIIGIFTYITGGPGTIYSGEGQLMGDGKFYGLTIEKDDEVLADYHACKYQGNIAIIDLVSENIYYPTNGSGLTAG